jgi:hypothetical protein
MPAKRAASFDMKSLSKGQRRKLEALRKSLGPEIADRAFAQWMAAGAAVESGPDRNAEIISEAVMALVRDQDLQFPRGGYIVRRGRGRIVVERARDDS